MVGSGAVILAYCVVGGLWAVVITDFLQAAILMPFTVVMFFAALTKVGGVSGLVASLPAEMTSLALPPGYFRNLLLPHPSPWDTWLHHAANLTYLVGCGLTIYWTLRARQDEDPMGRRLFLGFLGLTLPVVIEIAALSLFDLKVLSLIHI